MSIFTRIQDDIKVAMKERNELVKEEIASRQSTIDTLENYIEGHGYGQ